MKGMKGSGFAGDGFLGFLVLEYPTPLLKSTRGHKESEQAVSVEVPKSSSYSLLTAGVFRTQHPRRCWDVSRTCTLACCSSRKEKECLGT